MIDYRIPRVTAARHVRDHVVWLRFSDGLEGEVDLTDGLHGELLEPVRQPELFSRVRIDLGALAWPNGADWAPETLHERLRASNGSGARSDGDDARQVSRYLAVMPEISRFYGMIIRMLANDHSPPHFHAHYDEYEVTVTIRDGVVTGRFPGRALRLVLEWRELHGDELLANWERLMSGRPTEQIAPLS